MSERTNEESTVLSVWAYSVVEVESELVGAVETERSSSIKSTKGSSITAPPRTSSIAIRLQYRHLSHCVKAAQKAILDSLHRLHLHPNYDKEVLAAQQIIAPILAKHQRAVSRLLLFHSHYPSFHSPLLLTTYAFLRIGHERRGSRVHDIQTLKERLLLENEEYGIIELPVLPLPIPSIWHTTASRKLEQQQKNEYNHLITTIDTAAAALRSSHTHYRLTNFHLRFHAPTATTRRMNTAIEYKRVEEKYKQVPDGMKSVGKANSKRDVMLKAKEKVEGLYEERKKALELIEERQQQYDRAIQALYEYLHLPLPLSFYSPSQPAAQLVAQREAYAAKLLVQQRQADDLLSQNVAAVRRELSEKNTNHSRHRVPIPTFTTTGSRASKLSALPSLHESEYEYEHEQEVEKSKL